MKSTGLEMSILKILQKGSDWVTASEEIDQNLTQKWRWSARYAEMRPWINTQSLYSQFSYNVKQQQQQSKEI